MSHTLRMILGCVLPFALIFLVPLLGLSEGITLLAFFVAMFGCHLFMMRGHGEEAPRRRIHSAINR